MGSEQILKKSVLGGFKKEGVLNYIEQLQSEILNLKKAVNENAACKNELEELKDEKQSSDDGLKSLKEENDALKSEIIRINDENSILVKQNVDANLELEKARGLIAEYEAKQHQWEEKIALIEEKFAEIENSYSKIGETDDKVNVMLSDAKSYSDKIIGSAKASATAISAKAGEAIRTAKSEIADVNSRIQTACVNFDSSAASLKASTENLMAVLSELSGKMDSLESGEE